MKLFSVLHALILLMISHLAISDQISSSQKKLETLPQQTLSSSEYQSLNHLPISNIVLEGSPGHQRKLTRWLNEIALVPKGYDALKAIEKTGHTLTIKHSIAARLSSGRTIAPMTQKITNGEGDSVTIIFDATMEDRGTHRVFGVKNELIEFNAWQNLFHELAHAMHQMQGTWRYFASEQQAVEEENEFRKDWAKINGEPVRLRYRIKGVLITSLDAGGLGYQLPQ